MASSEKKVSGYAMCHKTKRRRKVESDTPESLQIKIDAIEKVWSNEILKSWDKPISDGLLKTKSPLEIFQRKISFPSKPKINKINFESCLTSPKIEGSSYYDVNINDIFLLRDNIKYEKYFRIEEKLIKAIKYPIKKPNIEKTPVHNNLKIDPLPKREKRPNPPPAKPTSLKKPSYPFLQENIEPKLIQTKFSDSLLILPYLKKLDFNIGEKKRVEEENKKIDDVNQKALREYKVALHAYTTFEEKYENEKKNFDDAEKKYEREFSREYSSINEKNIWVKQFNKDRGLYIQKGVKDYKDKYKQSCKEWENDKIIYENAFSSENDKFRELFKNYKLKKVNHIIDYFKIQLDSLSVFKWMKNKFDLQFDRDTGILLIELQLPNLKEKQVYKTKILKSGEKLVPATKKESQSFIEDILYLLVLRHMWFALKVDSKKYIELICCNGHVVSIDPATGKKRDDIIMSVSSKSEDLIDIKLDRVEPKACFRKLKGVSASKLTELVPIKPILKFNKSDSRFVKGEDVLDDVGEKNLASMDWQEFEHLIREIFEKEFSKDGVQVRITQASRDRGVDAIAFDPDPIHGGKKVIQAKRYTNTVDVSSVRDLYGTVMNEGADRGILVTTSDYGRDSFEFSKDKPLTLLNGSELLHLLKKHGYNAKIDLKEAKKLLEEENNN